MSTEGCVYPSTVWKCHPLRHDSRFGSVVDTNYLVNPGAHCKNCSFPSYKHIARRFGTIRRWLFSQNGRNKPLGCSLDAGRTRALSHEAVCGMESSGPALAPAPKCAFCRVGEREPREESLLWQDRTRAVHGLCQCSLTELLLLLLLLCSFWNSRGCLLVEKRNRPLIRGNSINFYAITLPLLRNSYREAPLFRDPRDK